MRDKLLGYPVKDRDWVVVGASPQQLLDLGYQQVGLDFPVFLHPKSKEEYALARTERKLGHGYTGFTCYSAPDVSLEQDLMRRDLTINAMAEDSNGVIYDPYNGQQDLAQRILRHVSPAFSEDPLRVLRIARFHARYAHLGFTIAAPTLKLMQTMVDDGELAHLVSERVWQETARAIQSQNPEVYFTTLQQCGALSVVMTELDDNIAAASSVSLTILQRAVTLSPALAIRFAALCTTLAPEAIATLCQRLVVPNDCRDLALLTANYHVLIQQGHHLSASETTGLFTACDAFRRRQRFIHLLQCCEAGSDSDFEAKRQYFNTALKACDSINPRVFVDAGLKGKDIAHAVEQQRLVRVNEVKLAYKSN